MKKKLYLSVIAFFFAATVYSQVGVNTSNPASSLDITAKNATGNSTHVDGLLIPRVDRERAQSMARVPVSTMIYVNDTTTGTITGTAVNIDAVGYYYYDGNVWKKLIPASANMNIYNTNGSLEGNRVVDQGDYTLAFTGSAVNQFSVDGDNLSVDASNHRVGIGTASPQKKLHINGSLQLTDELNVGGSATSQGSSGTVSQVLTSNGGGAAPSWERSKTNLVIGGLEAGSGIDIPFVHDEALRYTGVYITLPPGKWMITTIQMTDIQGNLGIDDWMYVRTIFSDQNLNIGDEGTWTLDIKAAPWICFRLKGSEAGLPNYQVSVIQGNTIIENTSGGNKTYRYLAGRTETNRSIPTTKLSKFGNYHDETSIFAIALN
ncbi:hypothetical protein [Chryseobacterium sp. SIMBA_028]|uniref:hypothetical protein n=2 Tax=Bacteria TaxID=2 RepID=UPI00397A70B4